jgi:hypothetical protein
VLLAERAILYALDFDLRINHPYTTLVQVGSDVACGRHTEHAKAFSEDAKEVML